MRMAADERALVPPPVASGMTRSTFGIVSAEWVNRHALQQQRASASPLSPRLQLPQRHDWKRLLLLRPSLVVLIMGGIGLCWSGHT